MQRGFGFGGLIMKIYFGWTQDSNVPSRYVHMSMKDLDDSLMGIYGQSNSNGTPTCPRCGLKNEAGSTMCARCYSPLTDKEAVRIEEVKTREEEIVAKVVKKLIEINPDLVERALRESGAFSEIQGINEGISKQHQSGADEGI